MNNNNTLPKLIKLYRKQNGLTQKELANRVFINETVISRMENGHRLPTIEQIYQLIDCFNLMQKEKNQLMQIYYKAANLLKDTPIPSLMREDSLTEAPDTSEFYGRKEELDYATKFIDNNCRILSIFGIGGIGKTMLATKIAYSNQAKFEKIIWCSLKNAPSVHHLLDSILINILEPELYKKFSDVEDKISLVLESCRQKKFLLILDNFETVLYAGVYAGEYKNSFSQLCDLVTKFGITQHQSCLILTSREKPTNIILLSGQNNPVREIVLSGLDYHAIQKILIKKEINGPPESWQKLIDLYSGNPLALLIVSETIREVFQKKIEFFLNSSNIIVGDIWNLLEYQFLRLSPPEQEVMYWLCIQRISLSMNEIYENFIIKIPKGILIESLKSLKRRGLILSMQDKFFLQNVILEFMTERFVKYASEQCCNIEIDLLHKYPILQANTLEYIRETQIKLIVTPLSNHLIYSIGEFFIEEIFQKLLLKTKHSIGSNNSYAPGNILNLLFHLNINLNNYSFSNLTIKEADFRNKFIHNVDLSHAHFDNCAFTENFDGILSISLSHNEKWLAAGSVNNSIIIWNINTFQQARQFLGHKDWVRCVEFSPTDQILVSSSEDQTIKLWNIQTGQCLKTLIGHSDQIWRAIFHPNGNILATSSDDSTIILWSLEDYKIIRVLSGHTDKVRTLIFSTDGSFLYSGSHDKTIKIWNTKTGECIHTIQNAHNSAILAIDIHPHETFLASGGADQFIKIWNSKTFECVNIIQGHSHEIQALKFSPKGQYLVSGSYDQTISLWDINTPKCLLTINEHSGRISSLSVMANQNIIISGSYDLSIRFWDDSTGICNKILRGYTNWTRTIQFHPKNNILAAGGSDNRIRLWDISSLTYIREFEGHTRWVRSVAFSTDGAILVSGSNDENIYIWDVLRGTVLKELHGHTARVRCVCINPDNTLIASASDDCTIRIWDVYTGECLKILQGHSKQVWTVQFHPLGNYLVSGSIDRKIFIWDSHSGNKLQELSGHTSRINSLAFNKTGTLLASGGDDRIIKIWDFDNKTLVQELQLVNGRTWSIVFHPYEKLLANSIGSLVQIWDIHNSKLLHTIDAHKDFVWSLAFNSDGSILASASNDQTIKLWDPSNASLISEIHNPKPYTNLNITRATGLTEAQIFMLSSLGAVYNYSL